MNNSTYHIFFRNLANPLRMDILSKLRENSCSVTKLSKTLNIEQSKLSHALVSLRKCSIVNFQQDGKQRIYSLNEKTILPILKILDNHVKMSCEGKSCYDRNCGGTK